MAERAKRFIDEYLSVFKAKNEKKMRKDNQLYETEVREVNKEKKRIKIHYKGFPEDTDEWHDYGDDLFPFVMRLDKLFIFDLEGFYMVSSLFALQLHYSKF